MVNLNFGPVREARKTLKTLAGTKEIVLLEERIALIDAAIALNKPHELNEHTLVTNLSLSSDHIHSFPPKMLVLLTEHLIKFRITRVFELPEREPRMDAIRSLVVSMGLWNVDYGAKLLDYQDASFIPLVAKLESLLSVSRNATDSGRWSLCDCVDSCFGLWLSLSLSLSFHHSRFVVRSHRQCSAS